MSEHDQHGPRGENDHERSREHGQQHDHKLHDKGEHGHQPPPPPGGPGGRPNPGSGAPKPPGHRPVG